MSDKKSDYRPIPCADYSAFEVAIMHRQHLRLAWHGTDGTLHLETVLPLDLQTVEGAEYLIARTGEHEPLRLRLDRIVKRVD